MRKLLPMHTGREWKLTIVPTRHVSFEKLNRSLHAWKNSKIDEITVYGGQVKEQAANDLGSSLDSFFLSENV